MRGIEQVTGLAPPAETAEAPSSQAEPTVDISMTIPSQDFHTAMSKAAYQIQLIEYLTAHQRAIKYASHAVGKALGENQSNRMSNEDVARKWLHTATEEIGTWIKQTKQMADEVENAGSMRIGE